MDMVQIVIAAGSTIIALGVITSVIYGFGRASARITSLLEALNALTTALNSHAERLDLVAERVARLEGAQALGD